MDLAFFNENRLEVGVEDGDLGEGGEALVVSLGLLQDFGAAKQGFQVLCVATLALVKHLLEEGQSFLLQVILHSGEIDPSTDRLGIQVCTVALKALVDDLACFFELADVP